MWAFELDRMGQVLGERWGTGDEMAKRLLKPRGQGDRGLWRIHGRGRHERKEFWEVSGMSRAGKGSAPSHMGNQGVGSEGRITGKSHRAKQASVKSGF